MSLADIGDESVKVFSHSFMRSNPQVIWRQHSRIATLSSFAHESKDDSVIRRAVELLNAVWANPRLYVEGTDEVSALGTLIPITSSVGYIDRSAKTHLNRQEHGMNI